MKTDDGTNKTSRTCHYWGKWCINLKWIIDHNKGWSSGISRYNINNDTDAIEATSYYGVVIVGSVSIQGNGYIFSLVDKARCCNTWWLDNWVEKGDVVLCLDTKCFLRSMFFNIIV